VSSGYGSPLHASASASRAHEVRGRPRLIAVAVPVPRLGLLTYRASHEVPLAPGMRVRVPLGARVVTGWVVDTDAGDAQPHPDSLKDIIDVLDREPFFPEDVLRLAMWTAAYYLCGPGETIAAATPPLARGERAAFRQRRVARLLNAANLSEAAHEQRTEKQREALALLSEAPDGIPLAALAKQGVSSAVIAGLVRRDLVRVEDEIVERDPFGDDEMRRAADLPSPLGVVLTADQQRVFDDLEAVTATHTFAAALLHGVTGSGKTQIYLRLAEAVRRQGRRVLMLVPEISLTPAMAAIFRRAFGDRVAIQHSGLSDGERHDQWHRVRRGDVDIVVGTRSAVFAPVSSLGLIVVDEEHDTSYKQEESPRYHGRDVAVMRAKQADALVLLGSATPSLETYQHALSGRYRHLTLDRRVLDRPLAAVRTVNMRDEYAAEGPDVILTTPLRDALQQRLDAGEQSLILLNRRGYATAIFCRQCGSTLECPNCSVTLTIHRTASKARCHYCDYQARVPARCVACQGEYLEYRGFGTERIEAELRASWPAARVARVDRDTVRRRGAIARLLQRFAGRELDVLVGTQMIAKGHDFPEVTLVGVISADVGLGVADFRAAERTFQLLTQVVGRAGRGMRQGEAIMQTLYPDHYSVAHAGRQDYRAFFDAEAAYRRAMWYPPTVSLINVIVRGASLEAALRDARMLARTIGQLSDRGRFRVVGPARAPLARLRGEHRAQFFLKGTRRAMMRQAVTEALGRHVDIARRTTVDVDPISML
jgi:primosomal protein N' (replication factor Y) (superfamily II helicase)